MKGQRTKQQNRSALLTITAVLMMLVVTMVGLTAIVSAETDGQTRLNITKNHFTAGAGLDYDEATGIYSKEYDGTNAADLVVSNVPLSTADGLLDADHDVKIDIKSATFDKTGVDATKIVVVYELVGADAGLYYAPAFSINAKITPKELVYDCNVTYNPEGVKLNVTDTVAGVNGETVDVSVNAYLGVLNASDTAYEKTGIATTDDANYVVTKVNVKVNKLEVTVDWEDKSTWTYGDKPIKAYANGEYDIFKLVCSGDAENWTAGNVGNGYVVEAVILDAYAGNYEIADNDAVTTKSVSILRKRIVISMPDSTVVGNGKTVYSISVQGTDIPAYVLNQITYKANGAAFNGFTYGEATVEAVLPTSDNFYFVNAEDATVTSLTATLRVLCGEKVFPVYDEDGNKVGDVILTSPDGFSNSVTAEVTALKGFPKIVKTKYNQVYNVKINGAAEGQTFSLIIPLTETVFGSRIEKLGVETLCVYEATTGTLTPATNASKGYKVLLGEGFYQVDGFANESTFVIAPVYNAPFFQTVWGILLIIVLVIAILVMMCYVGLYLRRILETREAPATVIDTIGELPETEPVELEEKEEIDVDAVIEQNLDEIAESVEETTEESAPVDETALDEAVEESIQTVVEEAAEIALDEEPEISEEPVEEVAEEIVEEVAEEVVEPVQEEAPVAEEVAETAEEVVEPAEEVVEAVAEEATEEAIEEVAEEAETESDDDNNDSDDGDDGDEAVEAISMVEDNSSFGFGVNVDPTTFVDVKEDPDAYQAMLDREARGEIKIIYRYKKSFQSKLAQSQGNVQDYYSELKNALLTFKGVKNRMSWNYEAFNKGRAHVAKMDAKSKTLYLYLALDPAQLAETKYSVVDVSAKRKYASTPTLMKIKGERKFKHALELIEKLCGEQMELVKVEAENVDYRVARMTIDEMVDAGLMKKSAGYVVLATETEPAAIPADAQVETAPEQN